MIVVTEAVLDACIIELGEGWASHAGIFVHLVGHEPKGPAFVVPVDSAHENLANYGSGDLAVNEAIRRFPRDLNGLNRLDRIEVRESSRPAISSGEYIRSCR